jgi:hypothetical protein
LHLALAKNMTLCQFVREATTYRIFVNIE